MLIYSGSHPGKFLISLALLVHIVSQINGKKKQFSSRAHWLPVTCSICMLLCKCEMMWCGVGDYFPQSSSLVPVCFHLLSWAVQISPSSSVLSSRACLSLMPWFIYLNHTEEQRRSLDQRRLLYDQARKRNSLQSEVLSPLHSASPPLWNSLFIFLLQSDRPDIISRWL